MAKSDARKRWEEVNKEKIKEYHKQYRKKYDPEKRRNLRLKRVYDITHEEWTALFESQNNRCGICKSENPGPQGRWHTDHCHRSKEVRGILCQKCNHALGLLKDNTEFLLNAIKYLEGSYS